MSKTPDDAPFIPLDLAVLTVSDSRTEANDTSGEYLREVAQACPPPAAAAANKRNGDGDSGAR